MTVFQDYAQFYDSLYLDKKYDQEVKYLSTIFQKYVSIPIKSVLDLGCGTASHDIILAKSNFKVTGIDLSSNMLTIAQNKIDKEKVNISLHQGNIQTIRLKKKFDAVISMFNVIGYQITNESLNNAFATVNYHLNPKGLFIFDCWFGPSVLQDPPQSKVVKSIDLGNATLVRTTTSKFDIINQTITITFNTKEYINNKIKKENFETHTMRFFFYQELLYFLEKNNLKVLHIHPFLKFGRINNIKQWNITVIAKRYK